MALTLREGHSITFCMKVTAVIFNNNYYSQFYRPPFQSVTITDSIHWSGNSSSFQIQLMSLWTSDNNVSPPTWISYVGIWSLPGDLYLFTLCNSNFNLRRTRIGQTLILYNTTLWCQMAHREGAVKHGSGGQETFLPLHACTHMYIHTYIQHTALHYMDPKLVKNDHSIRNVKKIHIQFNWSYYMANSVMECHTQPELNMYKQNGIIALTLSEIYINILQKTLKLV
jgi:hypothetical protein